MTKVQFDERVQPLKLAETPLFKPIKIGNINLSHRAVLAPLTRLRHHSNFIPNIEVASKYYGERSNTPGTLLITEGVLVSKASAGFYDGSPGIWSDEQVEAWSKIFQRVKQNKSFIIVQLFAFGRQAIPQYLARDGIPYKSASNGIYINDGSYPYEEDAKKHDTPLSALTIEEVEQVIDDFVLSGENSIKAGADGIQVHVANGYLLNQFFDPESNRRNDKYGGSIKNRSRMILEIVDKLIDKIGAEKISVRLSPYSSYGGYKGANQNPTLLAQYAHLLGELEVRARAGKQLQFIDLVEPRVDGANDKAEFDKGKTGTNEFVYSIWSGAIIRAGNYISDSEALKRDIANGRTLISFGRYWISNPDLPERLKNGYPLNKYDRSTFYTGGATGYIDYPAFTA